MTVRGLSGKISLLFETKPCSKPLQFSIGTISPEFKMSREEFNKSISSATQIWEDGTNLDLFNLNTKPIETDLKINLVYDYRQRATDELQDIGIVINNDKESYNILKQKYDSLFVAYQKEKETIQTLLEIFNKDQKIYENQITFWNDRGGAPKDEYKKLEEMRISLNARSSVLNERQNDFNKIVDILNSIIMAMNSIADKLKLTVNDYNTIGATTGKEFNQGEYIEDVTGKYINMYQFNNAKQLIRALEHELGHSLGLDHVEDVKAIMYRFNNNDNTELTQSDIIALKTLCKIK
ncbi:MAG: matrixin family metalloprotease [Bacteroidota bacterium]